MQLFLFSLMIMINGRSVLIIFLGLLCFLNYIFNSTEVSRRGVWRVSIRVLVDRTDKNI